MRDGDRFLVVETTEDGAVVSSSPVLHGERPYGIRAHAADVCAVAEGRMPAEHVELSGAFRYFSPREVDDLEAIRQRVLAPLHLLCTPAPETQS